MDDKMPDDMPKIRAEIVSDIPEGAEVMRPSIDSIPDLELLSSRVLEYIDFMDIEENIKMKTENPTGYNYIIQSKFGSLPINMIKLLDEREKRAEHLEQIMEMINMLGRVKNGQLGIDNAMDMYNRQIEEKYIPEHLRNKEQRKNRFNGVKKIGGRRFNS